MMKQLKWLCYLKSLKLLLSTLLIGFFGFWVNSFVNASVYFTEKWTVLRDWYNTSYNFYLDDYLDLYTIIWDVDYNNIWFAFDYSTYPLFLGWKWDRLYQYKYHLSSYPWNQWFLNNIITCTCWNNLYCNNKAIYTFSISNSSCSVIPFSLDNLLSIYNNSLYYWFWLLQWDNSIYTTSLCFSNWFSNWDSVSCLLSDFNDTLNMSLLDWQDIDYYINNTSFNSSPLLYNWWNLDTSDKIYFSDNNQIYFDTFKAIWFYEDLCYSNFELNDIVDIHTAYYDLFPSPSSWSGANIFELYNNWDLSTLNPFNAYFSWYSSRYNRLNSSSDKWTMFIMSLYSWDSIWNYYIFDKLYNNQFIDSYTISYKDYYTFCDMALNWFDSDWIFTWDTSISFNNIFVSNPCIRNWTCIDENYQFVLSGAELTGANDLFDLFNQLYTKWKSVFNLDSSGSWIVWFLPTYIIAGFFLFFLLYWLKR